MFCVGRYRLRPPPPLAECSAVLFKLMFCSCFAPAVLFLLMFSPASSPLLVPIMFFVLSCLELEEAGRDPPAPLSPAGETKKNERKLGARSFDF